MKLAQTGLEGVEVAETRLSLVDGERGTLLVCGRRLAELSDLTQEQMAELMWQRPANFGPDRLKAYHCLRPLFGVLAGSEPQQAVRLGLAALPTGSSPAFVAASLPVILAGAKQGENLAEPDPSLDPVADFLRLFRGQQPDFQETKALATYFVTVAEHGMNASTFCCRVAASTRATALESILAAYCALCGPLHGGAPGPVLDLLDELRESQDKEAVLAEKVRAGERLMGFGHRVYKTRDPRAQVLQRAVGLLTPSSTLKEAEETEELAQRVLQELKPGRALFTNVEFYTAVLLNELGFERQWFTPLFATGRVVGWVAHFEEQVQTGRLMRPKARYVGLPLQTPEGCPG